MSEQQRQAFEIELAKTPKLAKHLDEIRISLNSLKIDEQKFSNENYLINLIPNFRKKLQKSNRSFKIKFSYSLASAVVLVIAAIFFFNPFKSSDINSLENIFTNLQENEAINLIDYYTENFSNFNSEIVTGSSDSLMTDLFISELNVQESDISKLISSNNISLDNIYSELDSDEAETIYNEIIKTKFF